MHIPKFAVASFSKVMALLWVCGAVAAGGAGCSTGAGEGGGGGGFVLPTGTKDTAGGTSDGGGQSDGATPGDGSSYVDGDLTDAGSDDLDSAEQSDAALGDDIFDALDMGSTYTGPVCTKNAACKDLPETPYCAITINQCVSCLFDTNCTQPLKCVDFQCKQISCTPGAQHCEGQFLQVCNAEGNAYDPQNCPDGKPFCINNDCQVCEAGKAYCAKSDPSVVNYDLVMQCSTDGATATVTKACADGQMCINNACLACVPGSKSCLDGKAVACKADGTGYDVTQDCAAAGFACVGGGCSDPCSGDLKANTNVGCDYFAVDLDNVLIPDPGNPAQNLDAQNAQFSVLISNTKPTPATITVVATDAKGVEHSIKYTVSPNGLKTLKLPDPTWKISPLNQDGSGINKNVYRIKSNQPIVAYQFNPLANVGVFSNDASLLLPANGLGSEYWIMTREQTGTLLRSYFTVVAVQPGDTHVTIISSSVTVKSADGLVKAMKPGDTLELDLQEGQVLNVETDAAGTDPTGTWIKSSKPVAVFGGSEASNSPNTDHCVAGTCKYQGWKCTTNADCPTTCCSDHMEEQLFPVSSWGTVYLATQTQKRGKAKDAWRILAATDGTNVTTDPPQTPIPVLNQGAWFEFESDEDFVITSDKPVMVGQFMASAFAPGPNVDTCGAQNGAGKVCTYYWTQKQAPFQCTKNSDCPNMPEADDAKIGDPDFSLAVDKDRFLDQYVFLVPDNYKQNFINVMGPTGTTLTLDGAQTTAMSDFVGGWAVARIPVGAGKHELKSSQKVGLLVYGWSDFVSYSYPGGAALK